MGSVILSDILWIMKSKCYVYHNNFREKSASDNSYCTLLGCRLHFLIEQKFVMRSVASTNHQRLNVNTSAHRKDITLPTVSKNFQAV